MFHYREVSTHFDEPQTAIEVTQQRADGNYIVGYISTHGSQWFAYTTGFELLCDCETLLPALFDQAGAASEALADTSGYHLMPRYP